ncbi:MAG TPA: hypothetical protein ENI68_03085, partial [Gammaproteobacteria bacterium]|nr:hypothetical protein [Gammaproteobacteria bacterium]
MNRSTRLFDYRRPARFFSLLLLAGVALLAGGCGGGGNTNTGYATSPGGDPVAIKVNTAAEIAQVSNADYNKNVNGLITGATLQGWIDNWKKNRPSGITGRLIILQINRKDPISGNEYYITPKPTQGVFTYSIISDTSAKSRLVMSRSNGVTTTRAMVLDGASMDKFLHDYGIDPTQDMIVFAMGVGGYFANMQMGRGWYLFRYWGVASSHLAVLDGGANSTAVMNPSYLGSTATCDETSVAASAVAVPVATPPVPITAADGSIATSLLTGPTAAYDATTGDLTNSCSLPESGQVSVKNLPQDNTALQATLEDVMNVVKGQATAFIWDARSTGEYGATQGVKGTTYLGIDFRNGGAKQGHPKGAFNLRYRYLLMTDGSFRYKDKATLQSYMDGNQVGGGEFLRYDAASSSLVALGAGKAYQSGETIITYCETTYRAMITGIAAGVVLGLPVRFYDGA